MRQVVLSQDEDGVWVAEVPSFPGCVSQGASRDDALKNITEAARLWMETKRELGEPIPPDDRRVEVAALPPDAA